MKEFGIDKEFGFKLKRLNDLRRTMKSSLEQVTDPDSGQRLQIDLDEDDPFIQVVNVFIDELTTAWELLQIAYGQFNPQIAAGPSLSGLVQLNGIVRKPGTPSRVLLTLTGAPGLLISSGTQFTDTNEEAVWKTESDIVLDHSTGIADVFAISVENGVFEYSAGQIVSFVDIVSGLDSVFNSSATIPGQFDETDEKLRLRRRMSTTTPAQSIPEAIYGAILNLAGVELCRLYINNTLSEDDNGIPPKALAAVVVGGDDEEIAREIFKRLGVAVETFGNTAISFSDTLQQNNVINFVRPGVVPIYVDIQVSVVNSFVFPATGAQQIKSNILAYAVGGASAIGVENASIFDQDGFLPGEPVTISKLYTPILAVPGLKIVSVKIGRSVAPYTDIEDIIVDWDQAAIFSLDKIQVQVV